jgi:two-component system, LuxR family, sensor kinase FixL
MSSVLASPGAASHRLHVLISAVSALLALGVFAIDLRHPTQISVSALYIIPLLLSLWQLHGRDTFIAAAGCTALTIAGLFASEPGGTWTADVVNRTFSILGLWATALLVLRFRHNLAEGLRIGLRLQQEEAERIQAEHATRRGEVRIHSILETAVDAIVVIDAQGIIQIANPALERLFGYTSAELVGKSVSMLMPSPDREEHDGHIRRYLETGAKRIIGTGREVEALHKNGTIFPVSIAVSEMRLDGERSFTGIIHDLTRRKQIEARLREQSELARIGQMAAVMAHEVRNPLAGIRGALEVVGARLPAESRDRAVMSDAIARLDALNLFVQDVLLFSRPRPPAIRPTPLMLLLGRLIELLKGDAQFGDVTITVEGGDVVVPMDPQLIERTLHNLLANAAQALKGAGTISVRIETPDDICRISVSDNGPGIPHDVRARLFEPFFTTKHRGTGLGLAIAKRTVTQHGGSITVESTPDTGTTVIIDLPLPASEPATPPALV